MSQKTKPVLNSPDKSDESKTGSTKALTDWTHAVGNSSATIVRIEPKQITPFESEVQRISDKGFDRRSNGARDEEKTKALLAPLNKELSRISDELVEFEPKVSNPFEIPAKTSLKIILSLAGFANRGFDRRDSTEGRMELLRNEASPAMSSPFHTYTLWVADELGCITHYLMGVENPSFASVFISNDSSMSRIARISWF